MDCEKNQDFIARAHKSDFYILMWITSNCSVIQYNTVPQGLSHSLGFTSRNYDLEHPCSNTKWFGLESKGTENCRWILSRQKVITWSGQEADSPLTQAWGIPNDHKVEHFHSL